MKAASSLLIMVAILSGCGSNPPAPATTTVIVPPSSGTTTVVVPQQAGTVVVCRDGTNPPCR